MARSIAEMASFPDLQNWENSPEKVAQATAPVSALEEYLADKDAERRAADRRGRSRVEMRERQSAARREQADLEKLSDRLTGLHTETGSQKAGYNFEAWFYDLMDYSEIQNRRPYLVKGRQVDGSITIGDTTYLIELKFQENPIGAPDIDTFIRKVTTKADNTMGLMVSIAGYSSIAIQEASRDRSPILLLDHSHLFVVLGRTLTFRRIVERVVTGQRATFFPAIS